MRIALLTGEYPPQPGGVGDYTQRLAYALHERQHQVSVVTEAAHMQLRIGNDLQPEENPRHPTVSVTPPVRWDWRSWPRILAAIETLRPDVLHIQYQTGAYGMHPAINLLPWRLRSLPGRPQVVVTFHDLLEPYLFPKAGPVRRWVTRRLASDSDGVIVTNADDAHKLRRTRCSLPPTSHLPSPNVIPIGSNIPVAPPPDYTREAWRTALGLPPKTWLVAYFGLLSRSKGVDLLLEALAHLADAAGARPMRLLIIGGAATSPQDQAYAAEVRTLIDRRGLRDMMIWTGHNAATVVSAHLLAADCVALPFRDGASLRRGSLLATLLHGCPLITTCPAPASEAAQLLVDGEHALLIPPNDPEALTAALQRLRHDQALQTSLGMQAQQLGAAFDWGEIARQHERIYAPLCSHRPA